MRCVLTMALLVTASALIGCSGSTSSNTGTAPPPSKLVGVWEFTDDKGDVIKEMVVEFFADNKMKLSMGELIIEGTYKQEADKLTMTMKDPDGKEKDKTQVKTIKKLTDT